MKELFKKSMLAGLGLVVVSKDKIEESIREMIEKGNISEQEGRKLVQEMIGNAEKAKGDFEKMVDRYIDKALSRMDIVKKSDLQELQDSIADIQQRLDTEQSR
ncbi:MAG TPA: hypothetical protein VJ969_10320 [Desulfopila sp.]|nr:hypothetical protein [Desulfopila sp.]